jgi:predicted amidohydrolase YtcJ
MPNLLQPDLVLHGGKVVTVDADFSIAQAIAIRGDRIVGVGSDAEMLALCGAGTRRVSLAGRTVIPGLIDVHFQLFDRAAAQYFGAHVELPECVEDVLAAVRAAAARLPRGSFITCNPGWYPHMLREFRPPTRAELDAAAPLHPVVLWGEFHYLNSEALRLSGITRDTPQPEFGWIGKDEHGEPDGVLYGSAVALAHPAWKTYTDAQREEALRWAAQQMVTMGITSLRDPKRTPTEIRLYQRLQQQGQMPLRLSVQRFIPSQGSPQKVLETLRETSMFTPLGDHRFRIDRAGYFYTDGGYHRMKISGRYAHGAPGVPDDGKPHFEVEQNAKSLTEIVVGMAAMGFTGSIMAAGDQALDIALEALEAADSAHGIRDKRWVLAHVIYPRPDQIERIARLGCVVTPMWHHYYYYPTQVYYHGEALAQRTEPYRSLVEAGIVLAQGTDVSTIPLNYFPGYYFTVTRNTLRWGKANRDEGLSREQALRTMTINGAYTTFEEADKGSLEPGKLADLVVLSDDILEVDDEALKSLRVLATMIGGQVVHRTADLGVAL